MNLSYKIPTVKTEKLVITAKLVVGIILPLFAAYLAVRLFTQGKFPFFPKAAVNPSSLVANPSNINVNVGDTFQITIYLLPNDNPVSGVDVVLNYDSSYLTVQSIAKHTSSPFQTSSTNIDALNQTAEFTALAFDGSQPTTVTGNTSFPLATFTFLATKATPIHTSIDFSYQQSTTDDSNIAVISGSAVTDALVQPDPVSVTVSSGTSPTPTPPTGGTPTPGGCTPPPGDGDGNCFVNGFDYVIWLNGYGTKGPADTLGPEDGDYFEDDYDTDGVTPIDDINGADYVVWLNNYTG